MIQQEVPPRGFTPWRIWSATGDAVDQTEWLDLALQQHLGLEQQNQVMNGLLRLESMIFDVIVLWHNGWIDGVRHDSITSEHYQNDILDTSELGRTLVVASPTGTVFGDFNTMLAPNPYVEYGHGFFFASLRDPARQIEFGRVLRNTSTSDLRKPRVCDDLFRRIGGDTFRHRLIYRRDQLCQAVDLGRVSLERLQVSAADMHSLSELRRTVLDACRRITSAAYNIDTPLHKFAIEIEQSCSVDPRYSTMDRSRVYYAFEGFRHAVSDDLQLDIANELRSHHDRWQRSLRLAAARCRPWPVYVYQAARPGNSRRSVRHVELRSDIAMKYDGYAKVVRMIAQQLAQCGRARFSRARADLRLTRADYLARRLPAIEYVRPLCDLVIDLALPSTSEHWRDVFNDAAKRALLKNVFAAFLPMSASWFDLSPELESSKNLFDVYDSPVRTSADIIDKAYAKYKSRRKFAIEQLRTCFLPVLVDAVDATHPSNPPVYQ
jgi:hypothetical protein